MSQIIEEIISLQMYFRCVIDCRLSGCICNSANFNPLIIAHIVQPSLQLHSAAVDPLQALAVFMLQPLYALNHSAQFRHAQTTSSHQLVVLPNLSAFPGHDLEVASHGVFVASAASEIPSKIGMHVQHLLDVTHAQCLTLVNGKILS